MQFWIKMFLVTGIILSREWKNSLTLVEAEKNVQVGSNDANESLG